MRDLTLLRRKTVRVAPPKNENWSPCLMTAWSPPRLSASSSALPA